MTIAEIEVYVVEWPFKMPIVHNLARNTSTENIVVRLVDTDGAVGYGEGIPRRYVTGESTKDALDFLTNDLIPRLIRLRVRPERALAVLTDLLNRFYHQRTQWRNQTQPSCHSVISKLHPAED